MKAKPIDRLELTRRKFGGKAQAHVHREGYSKCPQCGQETLIHDGGCERCMSCSYSKCG